jgi:hypothetical protein
MEKALCEIILSWQCRPPPPPPAAPPSLISQMNIAINWNEISLKMTESGYSISSDQCLRLWMKLAYNIDDLITNSEEVFFI